MKPLGSGAAKGPPLNTNVFNIPKYGMGGLGGGIGGGIGGGLGGGIGAGRMQSRERDIGSQGKHSENDFGGRFK